MKSIGIIKYTSKANKIVGKQVQKPYVSLFSPLKFVNVNKIYSSDKYALVSAKGNIIKILGDVDGTDYTKEIAECNLEKFKKLELERLECKDRVDLRHLHTITIDSIDTIAYDDAISIHNNHLYVHISDVTSIKLNHNMLINKPQTIYIDQPHHMFDIDIIKELTLKENKESDVVTVKINLDNIEDFSVFRSCINVYKNYTYDNCTETNYIEIASKLGKLIDYELNEEVTYMKATEIYMVLTNKLIAKKLVKEKDKPLLRTQNNYDEPAIYSTNKDAERVYSHFTSPIRRYSDILVHLQLFGNYEPDDNTLDVINMNSKYYKMLYKYMNYMKIYKHIIENDYEYYDCNGIIVKKWDDNKFTVKTEDDITLTFNVPIKVNDLDVNSNVMLRIYPNKSKMSKIDITLLYLKSEMMIDTL